MIFRKAKSPSRDAAAATASAELSRALAEKHRRESLRLRADAEEAAARVRAHNAANHYAEWLQRAMRGEP